MRNQQAGLTLIETVIVLVVAALIIGGIWLGYSEARLDQQVNDTIAVMDQTIQVTRDYLSKYSVAQGVPSTLSNDLYQAGVMPARLSYKGLTNGNLQVFTSPLGYDFSVQAPSTPPSPYVQNSFEITIGLPTTTNNQNSKQCLKLLPKILGNLRVIQDRGLIGGAIGPYAAYGSAQMAIADEPNLPKQACAANNLYLYFSMRP